MHNLLADESLSVPPADGPCATGTPDSAVVRWYGKRRSTPGRKMGHLTAVGATREQARSRADASLQSMRTEPQP